MIVNPYGLFAVMTTTRPEIVIEGSADGETWREYVFRYKPGPLNRPPLWNIPHQPRLDWQMWFAALGGVERESMDPESHAAPAPGQPRRCWVCSTPIRFPIVRPRYVRASSTTYRFADRGTHDATGQWWVREPTGVYFPAVSLAAPAGAAPAD